MARKRLLTDYIKAAMKQATYEVFEDETDAFFGSIPDCQGAWASARTLEACRDELQEVLEGWIILGLRLGQMPVINGINLTPDLKLIKQEVA